MSSKPAEAQAGSKPLSHACGADDPAPAQLETCGNNHESAKSELQSVPAGTAGDVAETRMSLVGARYTPHRFMLPPAKEAGDQHKEQEQWVADELSGSSSSASDVPPPSQRRSEKPPLGFSFAGPGGLPLPPPWSTDVRDDGKAALPPGANSGGVGPALINHRPVHLPSARTTDESFNTLARPRATKRQFLSLEHREAPATLWLTACCLLLWLLALAIGFALLVVYLRYHHLQPPRMRVTTATLLKNRSNSHDGQEAVYYSLTIHADIYNPNTKLLHVVLRYVPLDLYFNGSLIGTGTVWPVLPIHNDSSSSTVQLLGSVTQEKDMALWHKVMNHKDGRPVPLELCLVGTFRVQLNIGRWIPSSFRFCVYSRCTLWLDSPPGGALRRSRCSPEYRSK